MSTIKRYWLAALFAAVWMIPACETEQGDDPSNLDAGQGGGETGPDERVPVEVVFDPVGEGFFATPWPSDARVDADGAAELANFPQSDNPFIGLYLDTLVDFVDGFSTVPVVYVKFAGPVGANSLPHPADTLDASSALQLIELGSGCGERVALESRFESDGDDYVEANVLAVAPVPGLVLEPETRYGLVVTREFGRQSGLSATPAQGFLDAMAGTHADDDWNAALEHLVSCLETDELAPEDIAVATVFTTQDPRGELVAMREVALDSATQDPVIADWHKSDAASIDGNFLSYRGTFEAPIFQRGSSPYLSGGGVEYENGRPTVQRYEPVPFMITFPEGGGPYPVWIWEDGTTATLESHVTSSVSRGMLSAGFAIATFEAQFHGDRATPGADPQQHTFNYLNPESGRTVLRQQVVDTAYFVRVLRTGLGGLEGLPALDTSRLVFGGQSQGALVGAISAGVETEIAAYGLNGIGGYLSITIVERKDPIDINEQIQNLLRLDDPIDRFHPLVSLAQMGSDVTDPLNYAAYWRGWDEHPAGTNVMLINGRLDVTTPTRSVNAITLAGDVAPIGEPDWDPDPFGVWDVAPDELPVAGNTQSIDGAPLTIATFLDGSQGHYTLYRNDLARELATAFWTSGALGLPEIGE